MKASLRVVGRGPDRAISWLCGLETWLCSAIGIVIGAVLGLGLAGIAAGLLRPDAESAASVPAPSVLGDAAAAHRGMPVAIAPVLAESRDDVAAADAPARLATSTAAAESTTPAPARTPARHRARQRHRLRSGDRR